MPPSPLPRLALRFGRDQVLLFPFLPFTHLTAYLQFISALPFYLVHSDLVAFTFRCYAVRTYLNRFTLAFAGLVWFVYAAVHSYISLSLDIAHILPLPCTRRCVRMPPSVCGALFGLFRCALCRALYAERTGPGLCARLRCRARARGTLLAHTLALTAVHALALPPVRGWTLNTASPLPRALLFARMRLLDGDAPAARLFATCSLGNCRCHFLPHCCRAAPRQRHGFAFIFFTRRCRTAFAKLGYYRRVHRATPMLLVQLRAPATTFPPVCAFRCWFGQHRQHSRDLCAGCSCGCSTTHGFVPTAVCDTVRVLAPVTFLPRANTTPPFTFLVAFYRFLCLALDGLHHEHSTFRLFHYL